MKIDKLMYTAEMEEAQRTMQIASCFVLLVGIGLCLTLTFLLGMAVGGGVFAGG